MTCLLFFLFNGDQQTRSNHTTKKYYNIIRYRRLFAVCTFCPFFLSIFLQLSFLFYYYLFTQLLLLRFVLTKRRVTCVYNIYVFPKRTRSDERETYKKLYVGTTEPDNVPPSTGKCSTFTFPFYTCIKSPSKRNTQTHITQMRRIKKAMVEAWMAKKKLYERSIYFIRMCTYILYYDMQKHGPGNRDFIYYYHYYYLFFLSLSPHQSFMHTSISKERMAKKIL